MTAPAAPRRPGTVTAVVVLTWLTAALDLIAGATLLAFVGDRTYQDAMGLDEDALRAYAIGTLVMGALVALVAYVLAKGSRLARVLVSALMVVRIALHMFGIIAVGTTALFEGIIGVVFAVLVLVLLWNERANAWFGRS